MRKISYLLLLAAVTLSACKEDYKKGGEGIEYKIIKDGSGSTVKAGDYVEFHITSMIALGKKDSMLSNTRETGAPQIMLFDSASMPPAYYKIFRQLSKGDSLATRILTDSVFKERPETMPPFMKKGQYLYSNIRILNIYKTKEEAEKARQAGLVLQEAAVKVKNAAQLTKDDKVLQDYFAKNNIKAVKTPKGSYVEIVQPGTGPMLDTSVIAKINYTGKTLEGKMFDSNTDPAKGHVTPLIVNLTNDTKLGQGVITGLTDGLLMFNKGAKGKIYIPSALAYGTGGAGADIGPNANLIFEVEILDILTKAQAVAAMEEAQMKMRDLQKKYLDSIAKVNPQEQQAPAPQR